MKFYLLLAIGAFFVLGGAAVWMGGLNQDEGWYLYAANLVAEGQVPYRDFFYTQGPMLPYVYSAFAGLWKSFGLLGARLFTLSLGFVGILFAVGLARRLVPAERRGAAALTVFLLLATNLYHLYFVTIPKTYALAALFAMAGFYLLSVAVERSGWLSVLSGLALAFATGTRISLGALLVVVGLYLLLTKRGKLLAGFCLGGFAGLALVYLPFLLDAGARGGLIAAQQYHAARSGFDITWTVGSLSRLVRWYLPVFIVLGLGVAHALKAHAVRTDSQSDALANRAIGQSSNPNNRTILLLLSFLAVFAIQMLAPFPYEDYQVPIVGLLAVYAAVVFVSCPSVNRTIEQSEQSNNLPLLLVLGLCFANSFGSPLLEKWSTNGQDRFWSLKKEQTELAQLRDVARRIETLDPGGKELLTQDLYLAIETGRKVPKGLEMGPFAMLTDDEWRQLLGHETSPLAAMSGYTFAVEPPECRERSLDRQMEYWSLLKRNYDLVERHDAFGQGATPLLILRHK